MAKPNLGSVPILTVPVDVDGVATPSGSSTSPVYTLQGGGPYTLANNIGITSGGFTSPVTGVAGGSYILAISASNFNSATIKLQGLLPDGVTWADITGASTTANTTGIGVTIGTNASVRLAATGGAPANVYATLS